MLFDKLPENLSNRPSFSFCYLLYECRVLARNLLPNTIGRYEMPSPHTAIELEARLITAVGWI